jgi:hypothetical protein
MQTCSTNRLPSFIDLFVESLFSIMCFYLVSYVLIQESILDFSNPQHESLVRTSFVGAASASKGKRLELSDTVCCTCLYNVPCTSFLFDAIMLFTHFITCVICLFSAQLFFPICHLEDWFTFSVDFKWKLFVFIDSFYGPKSDYQLAVQAPLVC